MSDTSLRARLQEVADLAGDGFEPPRIAVLATRRRGRYRTIAPVAAAAVGVLAIALVATMLPRSSPQHSARSIPQSALATPHLPVPAGQVSAAQLSSYRWAALPEAPIESRGEGVVGVWTGTAMIVWGGYRDPGGPVYGDGAGFDPATNTWTKLPPSPLGPRIDAAYAWTGQQLFIWGGSPSGRARVRDDGATYDPSTRRWHQLPPLPIAHVRYAEAIWTGDRVVLLTAAGQQPDTVQAHAYDPRRDSWTSLPSIRIAQTDLLDIDPLVVNDQLYVWMPVETFTGSGLRTGNDGFVYRPADNRWAATSLLPTQDQYSVGSVLSAGDRILFGPNGLECSCSPLVGWSSGSWANPRTGTVTPIPTWGPDNLGPPTVSWTGAAALAVGWDDAGAWNPDTNRWTQLAIPPYDGGGVKIWTGTELLIWGQLFQHSSPNGGTPPRVTEPAGLAFKP